MCTIKYVMYCYAQLLIEPRPKKLLDQVQDAIRLKHNACRLIKGSEIQAQIFQLSAPARCHTTIPCIH